MTYDELKAAHAAGAWIYGIEDDGKLHRIEDPQWICPADRYVALVPYIAELGQEVGAVAWMREGATTVMHNFRFDKPDAGPWIPLYTSPAHTSEARDADLIRALRNQYVSERTFRFQCENGMDYENARAHAESAVNKFEESFIAARERHAAMRQEGGSDA